MTRKYWTYNRQKNRQNHALRYSRM